MADEEYKLKEEYNVGEPEPTIEEPPSSRRKISVPKIRLPINKKILVILIIIIAVFIIFQFVKPKPAKKQPTPVTPTDVTAPATRVPLGGQLVDLMQKTNENSAKINNIENNLNDTRNALSRLDTAVNNLNRALNDLSKNVQNIARKQEAISYGVVRRRKMIYHVKAVVPGRAWLESTHGAIVTVRVGSRLKNYGTVTKIDDRQGIVKTDLGYEIKYGTEDI